MIEIRVLVISDDPLARAGLSFLLAQDGGIQVVGQAGAGEGEAAVDLYRPQVVVWDLGVSPSRFSPVGSPGAASSQGKPPLRLFEKTGLPLVLLVPPVPAFPPARGEHQAGTRPEEEEQALPPGSEVALPPGSETELPSSSRRAWGVLHRDSPPGRIALTIRAVMDGLTVQGPGVTWSRRAARSQEWLPAGPAARSPESLGAQNPPVYQPLTAREQEVIELLAEGLPNKQIAVRLGISDHTVKFHVNAILGKLEAESRTEAVTRAARLGWLKL